MKYMRAQASPAGGGSLSTLFDITVVQNDEDYVVTFRRHERMSIIKTETVTMFGLTKSCEAEEVLFLALYGALGKERCDKLLKSKKKGIGNAKTKRTPAAPKAIGKIKAQPKKKENKIVYGRGKRTK